METTRDLGRMQPWQESLERSLARRGEPPRAPFHYQRLAPKIGSAASAFEPAAPRQTRRQAGSRRLGVPVVGLGGVCALAVLGGIAFPSKFGERGGGGGRHAAFTSHYESQIYGWRPLVARKPVVRTRATAVHDEVVAVHQSGATDAVTASVSRAPAPHSAATSISHRVTLPVGPIDAPVHQDHIAKPPVRRPRGSKSPTSRVSHSRARDPDRVQRVHGSEPPSSRRGYVNPLAHAHVTPERIDQGVDYSGRGMLASIGRARITHVGTYGTGWPGAFIEYRLLQGPHAGRYVYYAEGVRPAHGIYVGAHVRGGHPVAYLIPGWSSGIEIGWGAGIGTETYAHAHGEYNYPTPAGKSFSALIASLGGPPGRG